MSVTKENITEAAQNDLVKKVTLKSWKLVDIASVGDNFASTVKCVETTLVTKNQDKTDKITEKNGASQNRNGKISSGEDDDRTGAHLTNSENQETERDWHKSWKCVVKLNPKKDSQFFKIFSRFAFTTEVEFFTEWLPKLNTVFKRGNLNELNVPKYFYSCLKTEEESIYMKDLRETGCHAAGNSRCQLNKEACKLILSELARLHAASQELVSDDDIGKANVKKIVNIKSFITETGHVSEIFMRYLQAKVESAIKYLSGLKNMEHALTWLKSVLDNKKDLVNNLLGRCDSSYLALCHGDTWTKNFLLNDSNSQAYLLDFQLIRKGPLAADINYLMHSSMEHSPSSCDVKDLLEAYYTSFDSVKKAIGSKTPFSRTELAEEVERLRPWGILAGVFVLPMLEPLWSKEDKSIYQKRFTDPFLTVLDDHKQ